jgi:hypothetical protein
MATLLTDTSFVLKPDFYRPAGRALGKRGFDQIGKVFF